MEHGSDSERAEPGPPAFWEQRRHCLENAADLIASAERILANDSGYPNIAYHLASLAVEEIGKAGMLAARGIVKGALDPTWMEKRLNHHVSKFMWAVWSPSLSGGKIDPKSFEEARQFAESVHARRMAGLYVDHSDESAAAPPRDAVPLEHATSLLRFAKAALEVEQPRGEPVLANQERDELLEWFFAILDDDLGQRRLFSRAFIQKHEELGGDTRAWVLWARDEFHRIAEEEKALLQRELSRQASEPGKGKPKWLIKIRLRTLSHSFRQKTLNFWNVKIDAVKLRAVGNRNSELMLEITLYDHVKIDQLFAFGLSFSKMYLVMLNIGTAGFFWYELSGQEETYYESIHDLETNARVSTGRTDGLWREWAPERSGRPKRQPEALQEPHLNIAMMCLAVFAPMPEREAAPIFGPYIEGLTLLSKGDLHLSTAVQARAAFLTTLRRAMHKFGDLATEDGALLAALHRVMEPVIRDAGHRDQVFASLEGPGSGSMSEAVAAKRAADLYLARVARRLWPEFAKGS